MAKKTTLDELAQMLTHVVKSITNIQHNMATKDDLKEFTTKIDLAATENRLGDRIAGLNVKVEGVQKTIDAEAMQRTDLKLPRRMHEMEEEVFGTGRSKHPKHLPL